MYAWRKQRGGEREGGQIGDEVRRILARAVEVANDLRHNVVGPEHVLLALVTSGHLSAMRMLESAGAAPAAVADGLRRAALPGPEGAPPRPTLPFTSRTKKALERAMAEARAAGSAETRPEHLLLGIAGEEKGIAARVLRERGATPAALRIAMPPAADVADSAFRLEIDESSERSIFEQIVAGVQEAVATGRLQSGARLPSVRRLADQLDVAPGTVARAYGELERMGVVTTDGARGTRVAERPSPAPDPARLAALDGMMRPVAIAAFHLGATAAELRDALDRAMRDILPDGGAAPRADAP